MRIIYTLFFHLHKLYDRLYGYRIDGMDELLPLRLSNSDVIVNKAVVIDELSVVPTRLKLQDNVATQVIPIVYRALGKTAHWIGIILYKEGGEDPDTASYKATYIDPENNPVPTLLLQVLNGAFSADTSIKLEQKLVKEQSYCNNCGPELIEHLAEEVTGTRAPEELVPAVHSRLFEEFLLHNSSRPMLKLTPVETPEQIVVREASDDPYYIKFMNLVSDFAKSSVSSLISGEWAGRIIVAIQEIVDGTTSPELQTDAQTARLSFLFNMLGYVGSVDMPPPIGRPWKPDDDPDYAGGGGGSSATAGEARGLPMLAGNFSGGNETEYNVN